MRGGFDVLTNLAGTLDVAGNEIDPVLREVLAAGPFGIGVNAVGVLQGDRVDGQLAMKGSGVVGIGRDDIEPVDEGRISVPKFLRTFLRTFVSHLRMPLSSNWHEWRASINAVSPSSLSPKLLLAAAPQFPEVPFTSHLALGIDHIEHGFQSRTTAHRHRPRSPKHGYGVPRGQTRNGQLS